MGLDFEIEAADLDEQPLLYEKPHRYVERLAREKAQYFRNKRHYKNHTILAADTSVVVDDTILNKPTDMDEALEHLTLLSGRSHVVLTAICVLPKKPQTHLSTISENTVDMRIITPAERQNYWSTGEPIGKAGSYAIQGLGAMFIRRIIGSYSGVMGLPIFETSELLSAAGIPLTITSGRQMHTKLLNNRMNPCYVETDSL